MHDVPSDASLSVTIRDARLSPTPTRIAVLRYLFANRGAVTHADVAAALGEPFERTSVYRALVALARAKVLTRADAGDHVWRFAVSAPDAAREHARFVCSRCGKVSLLPRAAVDLAIRGSVPRAVRARDVEVQLRGECDDCARAPSP